MRRPLRTVSCAESQTSALGLVSRLNLSSVQLLLLCTSGVGGMRRGECVQRSEEVLGEIYGCVRRLACE